MFEKLFCFFLSSPNSLAHSHFFKHIFFVSLNIITLFYLILISFHSPFLISFILFFISFYYEMDVKYEKQNKFEIEKLYYKN